MSEFQDTGILVVFAAGKASRALGLSGYGAVPKAFTNAGHRGCTVLEEITTEALKSGIKDFCFIIGNDDEKPVYDRFFNPLEKDPGLEEYLEAKGRTAIIDELKSRTKVNVHFELQPRPTGFGNAVSLAGNTIKRHYPDPGDIFIGVALSDDIVLSRTPALRQLLDARKSSDEFVVAVSPVPVDDAKKFGVVVADESSRVNDRHKAGNGVFRPKEILEKPESPPLSRLRDGDRALAIVGRYILGYEDIVFLKGREGAMDQEADFTDLIQSHINSSTLIAVELEGRWLSVGNPLDAQKAALAYALAPAPDSSEPSEEDLILLKYASELLSDRESDR